MSLFFSQRRWWFGYSVAGSLLVTAFFVTVNLVTSPSALWAVFPVFVVAWWPLAMYWFRHRRQAIH
jgi:hypothetical protein